MFALARRFALDFLSVTVQLVAMRSLLIPSVWILLGSSLLAQTGGTLDVKSMLQGLQDIKDKQAATAKAQLTQTITDFSGACANDGAAVDFYVQAVRVTRFVGQANADTAFSEWAKNAMPRLNPEAIRLALRYTTITLQRAAGATDSQIFPVLLAYVQDAQDALPAISAQLAQQQQNPQGGDRFGRRFARDQAQQPREPEPQILEEPVSENIFARWYNIGGQLSGLDNWEQVPSNIDAMYQGVLLPIMRKNRDPRVIQYWDNKILVEKSQASSAAAEFNTDTFNSTRRPSLLWSRAEDEVVIGQRDQGLTDMYNLVKAFPAHPNAGKWIKELQSLLAAPAPPVSTAGAQ